MPETRTIFSSFSELSAETSGKHEKRTVAVSKILHVYPYITKC